MNHLMKWNPFAEFGTLHRELATLIDGRTSNSTAVAEWAPVVDIIEDDTAYLIKAELPEVRKEDVRVQLEDGVLTLSGERRIEKEEKARKYHRVERAYGVYSRSFALPEDINPEKIDASYKDGVLTVSVAKSERAQPKKIAIRVN